MPVTNFWVDNAIFKRNNYHYKYRENLNVVQVHLMVVSSIGNYLIAQRLFRKKFLCFDTKIAQKQNIKFHCYFPEITALRE